MNIKKKHKLGLTLRQKIIFIVILTAFIVGLFSFCGYQYSLYKYSNLLYMQTANSLGNFTQNLSRELNVIAELSQQVGTSQVFQKNLMLWDTSRNTAEEVRARNTMISDLNNYMNSNVISIIVISKTGKKTILGSSSLESQHVLDKVKGTAAARNGGEVWLSAERPDGSILCGRQLRSTSVNGYLDDIGFLIFRVDLSGIIKKITGKASLSPSYYNLVIADQESLVYSYGKNQESFYKNLEVFNDKSSYQIKKIGNRKFFLVPGKLKLGDRQWNVSLGVPYDTMFRSIIITDLFTIFCIIFAIAIAIAISSFLICNITIQFNNLVKKMVRLKSGNFELLPTSGKPTHDELGLLNQYFDEMILEFKQTIDDNYVKQLLITEAKLKSLEQQINPHFLFNTLETINWFAKKNNEPNIPVIINSLANLLSSNLNERSDRIPFSRELSTVKSYLKIQSIRFPDILSVKFDISEDTLNASVPKMSLQPLVENAIHYTMEDIVDNCRIIISSKYDRNDLVISVEDNGPPIDINILDKLKKGEIIPNGNGIGLTNIDARIKILFGNEYGLHFENRSTGPIISYRVPYRSSLGA